MLELIQVYSLVFYGNDTVSYNLNSTCTRGTCTVHILHLMCSCACHVLPKPGSDYIGFYGFWSTPMQYISYVWYVDANTKCYSFNKESDSWVWACKLSQDII